jgi:hypothetical protein
MTFPFTYPISGLTVGHLRRHGLPVRVLERSEILHHCLASNSISSEWTNQIPGKDAA